MNIIELKKIRNTYGLSRPAFAEKLNISKDTLDLWEYRNKEIPADKEEYIKYVFSEYFIGGKDVEVIGGEEELFRNLPIGEQMNKIYEELRDIKNENMKLKEDLIEQKKLNSDNTNKIIDYVDEYLKPVFDYLLIKSDTVNKKKEAKK
ncbi:helix-turn-helix domain-containing protein [Chryseobacterium vrystaatense]|uniref:Uncharacterized protein n=1 Tax=Chryseobacterium vrystaatense TaxID=307480 RepID=A0A1M4ZFN8_9FLAO|nr:hypothetical protein [Chryseobacterium vrystaatense]SHF16602.1 hypothetical protein SAMN02787073_1579 [Chryseobacterium vrystaatense]